MPQLLLCKRYLAGSMRGQLSLEQVRARLQLMTEFISVFEKVNPGLTKWRGKMLYQVSSCSLVSLSMENVELYFIISYILYPCSGSQDPDVPVRCEALQPGV